MRFSKIISAGCFTGLCLSPVIAQETGDKQAPPASVSPEKAAEPSALENPGIEVRPSRERSRATEAKVQAARTEREAKLREQTRQLEMVRQERLKKREAQWEAAVQQRADLRQK